MLKTLAAVLLVVCVATMTASAQQPSKSPAMAQNTNEKFFGLDLFVGGAAVDLKTPPASDGSTKDSWGKYGWETGATIRIGVPWVLREVGITGTYGRYEVAQGVRTDHLLVGARFTSPYGGDVGLRGFVHALAGVVRTTGGASPQASPEFLVGGGLDAFLFWRIQFDYFRLNLNELPKNNLRVFVGGVLPLCLRGCQNGDLLDVSGRPSK